MCYENPLQCSWNPCGSGEKAARELSLTLMHLECSSLATATQQVSETKLMAVANGFWYTMLPFAAQVSNIISF